jgi:hypothetical protein
MCHRPRKDELRRVFVQIDIVNLCHNFAVVVMTTSATDVVRALKFATVCTLVGIVHNQGIMRPPLTTTGFGNLAFWDSHVTTSGLAGIYTPNGSGNKDSRT